MWMRLREDGKPTHGHREAVRLGSRYFGVPLGTILAIRYWAENHGTPMSPTAVAQFILIFVIGIAIGYVGGAAFESPGTGCSHYCVVEEMSHKRAKSVGEWLGRLHCCIIDVGRSNARFEGHHRTTTMLMAGMQQATTGEQFKPA